MRKVIILIPVFNDWESLIKLIDEISKNFDQIENIAIECLVVNDASTISQPKILKPKNVEAIKILNMKKNFGHARCNAFGIRYALQNKKFDYLILMDGDGEDRPIELKSLISETFKNPKISVVAKRIKRSEGFVFQSLYEIHKIITFIFTGKKINFGNFSCLTIKDAENLSTKKSLWSSYSGSFKKNIINYNEIDSIRGTRYFGPSKMSLLNLIIHSFSIIAVFKYQVVFRSLLILFILGLLKKYIGIQIDILMMAIIAFNFIIFLVSFREKEKELLKCQENLDSVKDLTH